jgi:hypothetical protein
MSGSGFPTTAGAEGFLDRRIMRHQVLMGIIGFHLFTIFLFDP